jgi:hypothetical protein
MVKKRGGSLWLPAFFYLREYQNGIIFAAYPVGAGSNHSALHNQQFEKND